MKTPRERNVYLDVIRVVAAFAVVFGHLRGHFFVPYKEAGSGILVKFLYIDHYVARAAVMCFFVLSGYLVGMSVLNSLTHGKWTWRAYLLKRVTRLQIVLIPALLLTLLFDSIGPSFSDAYRITQPFQTATNWFGCLFFFQGVVKNVLPYGSNGPLWSLSPEFWYYILFPLVVAGGRKTLIARIALFAVLGVFLGKSVMPLFPCWLAGVGAGLLAKKYPMQLPGVRGIVIVFSVLGIFGAVLAAGAHKLGGLPADYLMSAFAALLVWACLGIPFRPSKAVPGILLFSEFSYTLYLTHSPFLLLFKSVWLGNQLWRPDPLHVAMMLIPLTAAVLFAYCMYLLFESRTDRVRRWLDSRLPGGAKPQTTS